MRGMKCIRDTNKAMIEGFVKFARSIFTLNTLYWLVVSAIVLGEIILGVLAIDEYATMTIVNGYYEPNPNANIVMQVSIYVGITTIALVTLVYAMTLQTNCKKG